jgi:hypothetical protein
LRYQVSIDLHHIAAEIRYLKEFHALGARYDVGLADHRDNPSNRQVGGQLRGHSHLRLKAELQSLRS